MTNEDRIVELLAEALKRLDRHSELFELFGHKIEKQGEILEKQGEILEKQGGVLEKILDGQSILTNELIGLRMDFHKMNDHLLTRQAIQRAELVA